MKDSRVVGRRKTIAAVTEKAQNRRAFYRLEGAKASLSQD
jgi:hypothetical protein